MAEEDDLDTEGGVQEAPVQAPDVNPRERIGRAHASGGAGVYELPEGFTLDKPKDIGPKGRSVLDRATKWADKSTPQYALPEGFTEENPDVKKPESDGEFHLGTPKAFLHGAIAGVPNAVGSVVKGLGNLFGGDNALTRTGEGITDVTNKLVGFSPEEQNTALGQAGAAISPLVAAVLGAAQLIPGVVEGEAAVAAGVAASNAAVLGTFGVLGAAGGINEQAEKAKAAGMEPSTAANITGGLVGAAEGVAMGSVGKLGKILDPFAKAAPEALGWLKTVVLPRALSASAFGGLAVGDQYIQDEIHKQLVDPDAEFHPDFTSAAGQAIVGAIFHVHGEHKMPTKEPVPPGTGADSTGTGTPAKGAEGAEEAKRTATPHIDQTSPGVGKANEPAKPDISATAKANIGMNNGEADAGNTGRFKKVRGDDDRSRYGDDFVDPDKVGLQEDAPIQQGGHEPDNFVDPNKMPLGEGAPMQSGVDPALLQALKAGKPEPAPEPTKPAAPEPTKPPEPPAPPEPPPPHTPDNFVDPNKMGLQEGAPIQGSKPPPMAEAPAPTEPPAAEAAKAVSQRRQQLPKLEPKAEQPIPASKPAEAAPTARTPEHMARIEQIGRDGGSMADVRKELGPAQQGDMTAWLKGREDRALQSVQGEKPPVATARNPVPARDVAPAAAAAAKPAFPEGFTEMPPTPKAAKVKKVRAQKEKTVAPETPKMEPAPEPKPEPVKTQQQQEQPAKPKPYTMADYEQNESRRELTRSIDELRKGKEQATSRGDRESADEHQKYIDQLNLLMSPKVSDAARTKAVEIVRDAYIKRGAKDPAPEPEANRRGKVRKEARDVAPEQEAPAPVAKEPRRSSGAEQTAHHDANEKAVNKAFNHPNATLADVPKGLANTTGKLNKWVAAQRDTIAGVLKTIEGEHTRSAPSEHYPNGKYYYPTKHMTAAFKWVQQARRFVDGKASYGEFLTMDRRLRSEDPTKIKEVYDEVKAAGNAARKETTGKARDVADESSPKIAESKPPASEGEPVDRDKPHTFQWWDPSKEGGRGQGITRDGTAQRSSTLREAMPDYDFTSLGGRIAAFMPHIAKQIASLVPNVPVRFVSKAEMARIRYSKGEPGGKVLAGYWDPVQKQIVIRADLGHGETARVLLHEAIHAATHEHLGSHPDAQRIVRKIMDDVLEKQPHLKGEYEMSDEHEFLTGSLTDGPFQEVVMQHIINENLAKELGMKEWREKPTAYKAIVDFIRKNVMRLPEKATTALEAAMRVTDEIGGLKGGPEWDVAVRHRQNAPADRVQKTREQLREEAGLKPQIEAKGEPEIGLPGAKAPEEVADTPRKTLFGMMAQGGNGRVKGPKAMGLRLSSAIIEAAERMGLDPGGHARKLLEGWALRAHLTRSERQKFDGIQDGWLKSIQKYAATPEVMSDAARVLNESTVNGIDPLKPLTKKGQGFSTTGERWWQRRARDAELRPVAEGLPDDVKSLLGEWRKIADESSHDLAVETMVNRIKREGHITDDAEAREVAERMWEDSSNAAQRDLVAKDREILGDDWYDSIKDAGDISRLQGPYSPLGRSGRHVLIGKLKAVLTGKETVHGEPGDKEFSFTSKDEAQKFAEAQHLSPTIRKEVFDTKTGLDHDPETGTKFSKEDLESHEDLAQRWIIGVNDQHMSMHHRLSDAEALRDDMKASGKYEKDSLSLQPKEWHAAVNPTMMGNEYRRMQQRLEASDGFKRMSKSQQETATESLKQHFLQVLAATRAHSTRVQRKNVEGYDKSPYDMLRNFDDYASEHGKRMGTLKAQPLIDAALDKLSAARTETGQEDAHYARGQLFNELKKREDSLKATGSTMHNLQPAIQRLLAASYMMHLATPAFTIRNLTQPFMYTYPELAARYGHAKAAKFLLQAYKDIGAGKILLEGIKGTGRAFKGKDDIQTKLMQGIMDRLPPAERDLIQRHIEARTLDADAGLQIGRTERRPGNPELDMRPGKLRDFAEGALGHGDKVFLRMEEISRALPTSAEAINRVVSILASHRLEMAKSGDKEAAWKRSMITADQTQYRYTEEDKPAFQRHPLGRVPFQFKTFGMRTWETLFRHFGNVMHHEDPAERLISAKALAGLTVTHIAMAGALGLAWEPFRAALIGLRQAGFTDKDWDDVEQYFRKSAAAAGLSLGLSKEGAAKFSEVFNRGLPRLMNMDFSSGLGVDNMLLFSAPKAGQERDMDDNFKSWLFSQALGSAGEMGVNVFKGIRDAVHGDPLKAAQELVPFKALSDTIRAARGAYKGKETDRGRQTMTPYSPYEAGLRAAGIPVARESEQSAYAHQASQMRQKDQNRRSQLTTAWITADTAEQKDAARKAAIDGGLKMSDLTAALKRQRDQNKRSVNGAVSDTRKTSPVSKAALKELSGDYNLRSQ